MSRTKKRPVNEEMATDSILEYFAAIPDPRIERSRLHPLESILGLALIAVICGADSFVGMEEFGIGREAWLKTFLDFPHGIPSHDTIGRVFALLDASALQEAFRDWMNAVSNLTHRGLIALDGKTLRRSFRQPGSGFIHMVSAWSVQNRMVLAQVKTDEKSNEITAIPGLLELLNLKGCRVTIDAMGCQKEIAAKIVDRSADYMLAVKDNQPTLAANIETLFAEARQTPSLLASMDFEETQEKGHGRVEIRRCWTSERVEYVSHRSEWKNIRSLVLIESERTVGEKTSLEQRYYISSVAGLSARDALNDARSHWGIENGLHWVLDVAFREDDCRVRSGDAAENFAVIRHLALNLLKSVKGTKVGVKNRRLRAAIDESFLFSVLGTSSDQS
jgi:predicted transposase YbfD/YdcC